MDLGAASRPLSTVIPNGSRSQTRDIPDPDLIINLGTFGRVYEPRDLHLWDILPDHGYPLVSRGPG